MLVPLKHVAALQVVDPVTVRANRFNYAASAFSVAKIANLTEVNLTKLERMQVRIGLKRLTWVFPTVHRDRHNVCSSAAPFLLPFLIIRKRSVLAVWTGLNLVGILPSGHSGCVHLEK